MVSQRTLQDANAYGDFCMYVVVCHISGRETSLDELDQRLLLAFRTARAPGWRRELPQPVEESRHLVWSELKHLHVVFRSRGIDFDKAV